jgi:two-component system chemotaxis response regulator CheY
MLTVLVVDDSSAKRRMLGRALGVSRLPPHDVLEAASNRDALLVLGQRHVDLVLCALDSRKLDARALVAHLRADPALGALPVVMVGSERSLGLLEELEALGVRGFLREPFRPEALGQLVREILRLSEPS